MYSIGCFFFTLLSTLVVTASDRFNPLSDAFIELINKEGKWVAGRNFHPDTPMEHIRQLLGADIRQSNYENLPVVEYDSELINDLPENFDPRNKWPDCPSLNEIRDQGKCGACWAFSTVEAMTDRVCIFTNGTRNFHFSAEDLVTCFMGSQNGCHGGDPGAAWNDWVDEGYVSGGNYNSHQGCKPYSIPTCRNHMMKCDNLVATPSCVLSCENGYNVSYEDDKRRGRNIHWLKGEDNIMAELFNNGPVTAVFRVYEDFAVYKSGVYRHLKGDMVYGHAIKMMGWGVENGTKYWLIANSWNTDFGENGYFKILRGVNECGIESYVIAGEPLLEDYY